MNVKGLNRWWMVKNKPGPSLERRNQTDRRRCYRPKDNLLASHDRSKLPDRRLSNLAVEWLDIGNYQIPPVLRVRYFESILFNKTQNMGAA
jgi:hypothetical protein